MMTEQPFLPLFFNSEDEDLWTQLQKFSPEKRCEITKQALHEFLQDHPGLILLGQSVSELPFSELTSSKDVKAKEVKEFAGNVTEEKGDLRSEKEILDEGDCSTGREGLNVQEEFSLESLFEVSTVETRPDPLQNLLSIIGEEEDEEVICLLHGATEKNKEQSK